MKVVIFAGGRGSRLEEETRGVVPKPMVAVGDRPILAHIIGLYSAAGFSDFVIAAGFRADAIQEWWSSLPGQPYYHGESVQVFDTGLETQTGGRLRMLAEAGLLTERFMLTYGDGLADINLRALIDFHERLRDRSGVSMTLTAVRPPGRWGALQIERGMARLFTEKSQLAEGWINGGFYVAEPEVLRLIADSQTVMEYDVLPALAIQDRLAAYQHTGWWQGMDHPRDKVLLDELWQKGAPWARLLAR